MRSVAGISRAARPLGNVCMPKTLFAHIIVIWCFISPQTKWCLWDHPDQSDKCQQQSVCSILFLQHQMFAWTLIFLFPSCRNRGYGSWHNVQPVGSSKMEVWPDFKVDCLAKFRSCNSFITQLVNAPEMPIPLPGSPSGFLHMTLRQSAEQCLGQICCHRSISHTSVSAVLTECLCVLMTFCGPNHSGHWSEMDWGSQLTAVRINIGFERKKELFFTQASSSGSQKSRGPRRLPVVSPAFHCD